MIIFKPQWYKDALQLDDKLVHSGERPMWGHLKFSAEMEARLTCRLVQELHQNYWRAWASEIPNFEQRAKSSFSRLQLKQWNGNQYLCGGLNYVTKQSLQFALGDVLESILQRDDSCVYTTREIEGFRKLQPIFADDFSGFCNDLAQVGTGSMVNPTTFIRGGLPPPDLDF